MNFTYSCFISYRRNLGDEKFIKKFTALIESEAHKVTNIPKVFFDEKSIKWGNDFDDKIYEGIVACYFFIPFYHNTYLHIDSLWCAKELYRAIKVEEKIRESGIANYCFILPIIDRGSASAFPKCIGRKNAREVKRLRHIILNNRTNSSLEKFKEEIYETLLENYNLLNEKFNLSELCASIEIPSDEIIKEWIKQEKKIANENESKQLPILKLNEKC